MYNDWYPCWKSNNCYGTDGGADGETVGAAVGAANVGTKEVAQSVLLGDFSIASITANLVQRIWAQKNLKTENIGMKIDFLLINTKAIKNSRTE